MDRHDHVTEGPVTDRLLLVGMMAVDAVPAIKELLQTVKTIP